ncbi:MAG: hypothetical protein EHM32_09540 [Spirochaetales bacterium]|nr:MAG: hypothetical protein EHM32_09540 [Spirochaetales bacterium]
MEKGEAAGRPVFGIAIATPYKMLISGPNTIDSGWEGEAGSAGQDPAAFPREGVIRYVVPELPLFGGEYLFSASVYNENLSVAYDHHELQYSFQVVGGRIRDFGLIKIKAGWLRS